MSENNLQDRDKSNAIETYKYLLKITEDLLVKGGYPREILNKYYSLKEISLLKLKELPPPPIPNENNNNKLILNEENELSFNNQIIPKEVEKVDNYLGSLYSSIKAAKNNLCLIKLQENVEENNGKTLENCNFKFVDINEFFTSNGIKKIEINFSIIDKEMKKILIAF